MIDIRYGEIKPTLLAVDNDQVTLHLIDKILGAQVDITKKSKGCDALDYLARHSADLVLLDYNMQDMNGIEVLKCMKQRAEMKNIPVIILTADVDIELETEVFQSGAVDFIRKPFVPMAMQERVWRILQNEYLKKNLRQEAAHQMRLAEDRLAASDRLFHQTILALAKTIDAKDKYTQGHSQRVADYVRRIAKIAGASPKKQQEIYCMGLLHDIGKIGVPSAIINKPTRLTDEEYELIKSHTTIGSDILKSIKEFPMLSIGARSHHERWDGKGYPDGLAGTDIPEEARMIAVADAYDAMTSRRSYRDIMPQERVRREVERGRGTQFDPHFADIMLTLIHEDTDFLMRSNS